MITTILENSLAVAKKIKYKVTYDPAIHVCMSKRNVCVHIETHMTVHSGSIHHLMELKLV